MSWLQKKYSFLRLISTTNLLSALSFVLVSHNDSFFFLQSDITNNRITPFVYGLENCYKPLLKNKSMLGCDSAVADG